MMIHQKRTKPAKVSTPAPRKISFALQIAIVAGVFTLVAAVIAGVFAIAAAVIESPTLELLFERWVVDKPTASAPGVLDTVGATGTQAAADTAVPQTPVATPFAAPTAWPLIGSITHTDPGPICAITARSAALPERAGAFTITFDIPSEGGYCTWEIPLRNYDASGQSALTFWVKGQAGGEQFEVGLAGMGTVHGQEVKVAQGASAQWKQITIPLSSFKSLPLDSLENISLGFTHQMGSGSISVADFVFVP